MKCPKCGKTNKDDNKFCAGCGSELKIEAEKEVEKGKAPKNKQKKFINMKTIICFISVGLIIGIILIYHLFFSYTTYEFNELYDIKVEGINGYGTLVIEKKKNLPSASVNDLIETVTINSSKESNLKNGDVIKITLDYDEKVSKKKRTKFTKEYKYEVKNLEEGKVLDLFKDIEFTYISKSPYLMIVVSNEKIDVKKYNISYKVSSLDTDNSSEPYGLYKNGEKIKVTATYDEEKIIEDGYIVQTNNKEFEVPKQDMYITSAKELTKEMLNPVLKRMSQKINNYMTQENLLKTCANKKYCTAYKLKITKSPTLVGLYLGYKEGAQSGKNSDSTHTTLIGIYEINYKHEGAGETEYNLYFYAHEDNFYLTKDGVLSGFENDSNVEWDHINGKDDDMYLSRLINNKNDDYKFDFEKINIE